MILVNQTAHVILFGGYRLVPSVPLDIVEDMAGLSKYPAIVAAIEAGKIKKVTKAAAKRAERALSEQTVAELKTYAKSHGVKLAAGASKADILAAIKVTRGIE